MTYDYYIGFDDGSKRPVTLSKGTANSIGREILQAKSVKSRDLRDTLKYLADKEEFGHLAFNDVLMIAREIHLAVERTEEQYKTNKTDFEAINEAKAIFKNYY